MEIKILEYIEGAKKAEGLTVIIDVIRAFSLDCYLFKNGAEKIIPVGDINLARQLKKEHPDYILMGERNEQKPEGFDYGNSPTFIQNVDFTGKIVIQTTGAGTQGIVNAVKADEIITGSFVNAGAVAKYIKKQNPKKLSLVAMGYRGNETADEDIFCARYIKNLLTGKPSNLEEMAETIKNGTGKRLFLPENQAHSPASDFYLCLQVDAVDFVIKAVPCGETSYCLTKII